MSSVKNNPSLFISYSNKDKEIIAPLVEDLTARGIDVRYDQNLVEEGSQWRKRLAEGLANADAILVLLTSNSLSSTYVMNELGAARTYADDPKNPKILLPVIYQDTPIPDFIKDITVIFWKEDRQEVVERIMKALTKEKENPPERDKNFWLLKLNPQTWAIEELKFDINTFFSTYYLGTQRPEYHLFKEIKKGDYVLGFASGDYQSIVCVMEVFEPVGPDKAQGEVFKMVVKKEIKPYIPLKNFRNEIAGIVSKLEQNGKPPELFFSLTESEYKAILDAEDVPYENLYQPFYVTEGNHEATNDQLDFKNDIDSFATVITLEKVQPPLAIGLFGNWGSGKSFFMEKLSECINKIVKDKEPGCVQHVVQVSFNSWHYSDANLWASLTTQIFESLHDYAKKKEFGDEAIKAIYKDLNITTYQLEETQKKLDANEVQAKVLEEQKANVEKTIEQKKETLSIWSAKDIIKLVFGDPYIQKDFQNIKDQFKDERLIDNIDQIDEKLAKVDSVRGQLYESFVLLKEHRKGNWKWIWILAVVFAIIGFLVLGPLKDQIENFINGGYIVTGLVLGWVINLLQKISPYFNKVTQFYKRLRSLKQTIEKEKENVRLKEHDEVERLQKDINSLAAEKANLELEQRQTEEKRKKLENEIKEIGSGKLLANFLADKSVDDAYVKQLGIVSWIRKDFKKLDDLFKKQKSVQAEQKDLTTEVQIDRIVLYIDDLDRCNEDVVVKVLEAIHLLLAFRLFVVVVGVDPRWLNNALSEKYKNLFGNDTGNNPKKKGNGVGDSKTLDQEGLLIAGAATSYDYLEKIFQIPFALKPIDKSGRRKLIQYLMRDEMTEDSNPIPPNPLPPPEPPDSENAEDILILSNPKDEEIKNQSHEENHEMVKRAKERVVFTASERDYMQSISSLFGQTPRTINRYVNIYRIIKAHGNLKVTGDFSKDEFMPIMFVLAVIVGHSVFAEEFIREIDKSDGDQEFRNFLQGSKLHEQLKSILKPLSKDIESMPMKNFQRNLELISRFSFRTLLKQIN